jgi:hypothetical protein
MTRHVSSTLLCPRRYYRAILYDAIGDVVGACYLQGDGRNRPINQVTGVSNVGKTSLID